MEILNRYLDKDFQVFPMAEGTASFDEVKQVGDKFGVVLPEEYVAHVCGQFPGIFVEVKENVWPRAKEFDVGPFWTFLYAIHTFTPRSESEDWMRMDHVTQELCDATGQVAVPILRIVSDADYYCVNQQGEIVRYCHETDELEPVAMGFWELFEYEIKELKERKMKRVAMGSRESET